VRVLMPNADKRAPWHWRTCKAFDLMHLRKARDRLMGSSWVLHLPATTKSTVPFCKALTLSLMGSGTACSQPEACHA